MVTMKRAILFVICITLITSVTGCDLMTYIRQHIVGHGYNQVAMSAIQNTEGNMRASSLQGGVLTQNTVIVYKTRHGYYGKLAMLSAASASGFICEFTTYNADGSVLSSAGSLTVSDGRSCDLETSGGNPAAPAGGSEFTWSAGVLSPQGLPNTSLFYILP
jgi:hypothetical protein